MSTPSVIYMILLGLAGIAALAYIVWWGRRLKPTLQAVLVVGRALAQPQWTARTLELVLEYGRRLNVRSARFEALCIRLAQDDVADPRAHTLWEHYFLTHPVTPENAVAARQLARMLVPHSAKERYRADAFNAMSLLDRVIELNVADEQDYALRAKLGRQWVDVSPASIGACMRVWHPSGENERDESLTLFLAEYLRATWPIRHTLSNPSQFVANAAPILAAMADRSLLDWEMRRMAIEAAFESGGHSGCFRHCTHARDYWGPLQLDDDLWRMWGASLVTLEGADWSAWGDGRFSALPKGYPWLRLQEILDHARRLSPDDQDLLTAQAWASLGANVPIERALPVYEEVFRHGLPIAPALHRLAEYYVHLKQWANVERVCRALLPLQPSSEAGATERWLAQAIVEGNLPDDMPILERDFERDPGYPALNARLVEHYVRQTLLSPDDLERIAPCMNSALPESFSSGTLLRLRERFLLAWLDSGRTLPQTVSKELVTYVDQGGTQPRLLVQFVDANIASAALQLQALELLVRERPVKREHCARLLDHYAAGAAPEQLQVVHAALESFWQSRPQFDEQDCALAIQLDDRVALADVTRLKLLQALTGLDLSHTPPAWRAAAIRHLGLMLAQGQFDEPLYRHAVEHWFTADDTDPVRVWVLEALCESPASRVEYGLRLLSLYDAGATRPGETTHDAQRRATHLGAALAALCYQDKNTSPRLFGPLLTRTLAHEPSSLPGWEIGLLLFGVQSSLIGGTEVEREYAINLSEAMLAQNDLRAVDLRRWAYERGAHAPDTAAGLFALAGRMGQTVVDDPYWLDVARLAEQDERAVELARDFMLKDLVAAEVWDERRAQTALKLVETLTRRQQLAPLVIRQIRYGRAPEADQRLLDLVDEKPDLGYGHLSLLLALVERREARGDIDGALEVCWLAETSTGESQDVAACVLKLLPHSSDPAVHANHVADYVRRYRNVLHLLELARPLALDPRKPLTFDLAFAIVEGWASRIIQIGMTGADARADQAASAKCDLYELYRDSMMAQDARMVLQSISPYLHYALSTETRQRIAAMSSEILQAASGDDELRLTVASVLYDLADFSRAAPHLVSLLNRPDQRAPALQALERIADQLEAPRREADTLVLIYHSLAEDALRHENIERADHLLGRESSVLDDETIQIGERLDRQRSFLALRQQALEARQNQQQLTLEQQYVLAETYSLLENWEQAGRLYARLALVFTRNGERAQALSCAGRSLDNYYRARPIWWSDAGRQASRILWGHDSVPPLAIIQEMDPTERHLLTQVAAVYHAVWANLDLDLALRARCRRDARTLYERLLTLHPADSDALQALRDDAIADVPALRQPIEYLERVRQGTPAMDALQPKEHA